MAYLTQPKFDEDLVNKGYVDGLLRVVNSNVATRIQNFGSQPIPPYYINDTYMNGTDILICIRERLIGSFNSDDWQKASSYTDDTLAESKNKVFNVQPVPPYKIGDLWTGGINGELRRCVFTRLTGVYTATDWENATKYDSTSTVVEGGLVTTGTIQVVQGGTVSAGITGNDAGDGGVRFWAGSSMVNRYSAPFRVTQAGALYATGANISGNIYATSGTFAGEIYATGGTFTGTINSATINASSITANSNINITRSSGSYYFNMGIYTDHPNASGLNVGWGGINFRGWKGISMSDSTTFTFSSSKLTQVDEIHRASNGAFLLQNDYLGAYITLGSNVNIQGGYTAIQDLRIQGTDIFNASGAIGINAARGSSVWAEGNDLPSSRVLTSRGASSSRILKENFIEFDKNDYSSAYNLLKKINIYEYDYKYKLYEDKHQYGFIIDELEEQQETKKFFRFKDMLANIENNDFDPRITDNKEINRDKLPKNIIKYKEYDANVLDKYLLTVCKALQEEIETLKKEINEIKGGK